RRRAVLRRQGQVPPDAPVELLPQGQPRREGRQDRRPGAARGLGAGPVRVRGTVARAGTDPPLAAALERGRPAAAQAPRLRLPGAPAGPPRLPGRQAALDGLVLLRPRRRAAAGARVGPPTQRLVPPARLPAEAGDGLRRPAGAVPPPPGARLPAPR